MTYKAIVKEMVREKARKWVNSLLNENNISYEYTLTANIDIKLDKESDCFLWEVIADIYGIPGCGRLGYIRVCVGGSADDLLGICCSVIWSSDKKTIIWMASDETRKDLNITEFKIS